MWESTRHATRVAGLVLGLTTVMAWLGLQAQALPVDPISIRQQTASGNLFKNKPRIGAHAGKDDSRRAPILKPVFRGPIAAPLSVETADTAIRNLPGFTALVLPPNDDGSTLEVPLGFTVNFFGVEYNALFVNNNGNVTFDEPLSEFTPFDLTSTAHVIIAPFFADVDTRREGSGVVTFGQDVVDDHPAFGVNWIDAGYFSHNVDKLNSFQVVLIDRSDVGPGDFDIELNYAKIQWETGDASEGEGGLGGFSARAGFSNGTGEPGTFFELPGSAINGAFLDDNSESGLIHNSFNSTQAGRYLFLVRSGVVTLADLALTKTDSPDPVEVGNNLTYTITVTNNGPDAATGTVLTDALPAGVTLVSATPSQGSCSGTSTVTCNLGTLGGAAVVTFLGPTPYLSQADSPFDLSGLGTSFFLEDFEDGLLNTPGISASAGIVVPPGFEGLIDSVDGDDGAIDGSGLGGHSFFSGSGSTGLTFTFDAAVLGFLPTHAGIVWTDGAGTTTFEAFDAHGMSLGTIGPVSIADSSFSGTTTEDRFFGVIHPGGLSAIKISNTSGGIEVDHLQYGQSATNTSPASAMVTIVVIPTAPGTLTNTASVTSDVADPDEMNNTATTSTTVWSLLFGDGTTSLGINTDTGDFTLTYLADGEPHVCSGTRARVGDGFLTISDRCTPDLRDRVRATGAIDGSITLQLLDRTGPAARDRVIRHFSLTRTQPPLRDASRRLGELVAGGWECEGYCGWQ